jgi:hypothetical protein
MASRTDGDDEGLVLRRNALKVSRQRRYQGSAEDGSPERPPAADHDHGDRFITKARPGGAATLSSSILSMSIALFEDGKDARKMTLSFSQRDRPLPEPKRNVVAEKRHERAGEGW